MKREREAEEEENNRENKRRKKKEDGTGRKGRGKGRGRGRIEEVEKEDGLHEARSDKEGKEKEENSATAAHTAPAGASEEPRQGSQSLNQKQSRRRWEGW